MRRAAFTSLTIISLLLSAATVGMWIRSYWCEYGISRARVNAPGSWASQNWLVFSAGQLIWSRSVLQLPRPLRKDTKDWYYWHSQPPFRDEMASGTSGIKGFGFRLDFRVAKKPGYTEHIQYVAIPCWLVVILFAVPGLLWLNRRLRVARRRPNVCAVCGYDLRATPDRCPECGTKVAQPIQTTATAR